MHEMRRGSCQTVGGCVGCIPCCGMGNAVLDGTYYVCLDDLAHKWQTRMGARTCKQLRVGRGFRIVRCEDVRRVLSSQRLARTRLSVVSPLIDGTEWRVFGAPFFVLMVVVGV